MGDRAINAVSSFQLRLPPHHSYTARRNRDWTVITLADQRRSRSTSTVAGCYRLRTDSVLMSYRYATAAAEVMDIDITMLSFQLAFTSRITRSNAANL